MNDAAYLDAVARGDMKTAQRMVDAAANAAGYTEKGFHRTPAKFTKFIPGGPKATAEIWMNKEGQVRTLFGQSGRAMWFGSKPTNLPAYHNDPSGKGVVLSVYLKNPSPLQIDDDTREWARVVYGDGSKEFPLLLSDEHIKSIRNDGYTGIEYWQKGKIADKSSPDEIVVFDANQIKLADPVTYDDKGNVIPISKRFDKQTDDIRNPRRSMMGININDSTQDFTGQILRGEKTIETRSTRSLDPYIGERVGLIRTGVGKATLVGYATVGEPVFYDSVAKFRKDYDKHLVAPGSAFDIKDRLKYGYPLMQVEAITPKQVQSKGIVARRLNPATPQDLPPAQGAIAQSPQIDTPAFKRWFDGSVIVTRDGKPRVMYHGTGWTNIREFESYRSRGQIAGFFAFDPEFAGGFASQFDANDFQDYEPDEEKKYPSIYPVYLSLKKVFNVRSKEDRDAVEFDDLADMEGWESGEWGWNWTHLENKTLVRRMKEAGFDGYIDFERGVVDEPTGIAVFDPRNIKSAIGNRGTFDPTDPDIRNPYTRPDLRERLKRKIMAGSKGGRPGQWSARKAQLLAAEYEKAGGGYTGKRSASQRSLSRWSKQDWRTKSGKPSLETGERYLPAKAIEALSPAEYGATTRAKRRATGQFSRQPKRIAMKTAEYRNPMDPRSAKTQIATTVDTYRKAAPMLGGKVLDYGAGLGLGTDALREEGLLADSFEPYPERWKGKRPPTYTDSADIPSGSYDGLVSFSVINVVEPDVRKFLFKEVARILQPDGTALITGRTRQDVGAAKNKTPHLEDGGYLVGEDQRYQKGFTQAELERYAKEVLGPGFTVEANRALNGASIKITKGKPNPAKRSTVRSKLSQIIEPGDRMVCYDTASGEDFYRLWDIVHTALPLTEEALTEIEGMLDDDGVLVIESGETPAGLQDHFRKATRYNGLLLVQGPKDPEGARIKTEELRRELE